LLIKRNSLKGALQVSVNYQFRAEFALIDGQVWLIFAEIWRSDHQLDSNLL